MLSTFTRYIRRFSTNARFKTVMSGICITDYGGPDVLEYRTDLEMPNLTHDTDLLIKVSGCGVNRPDCIQRKGLYPPPPGASPLPGLEVSGIVTAVGPACSRFKVGDEVMSLLTGGGYAEYVVANEQCSLPIPKGVSLVDAASIPENYFTVWSNLFQDQQQNTAMVKHGDRLLVHGGTSGIGTAAIQLGKCLGATVFTTAGSAEKVQACLDLGADFAFNYKQEDDNKAASLSSSSLSWEQSIRAATDNYGVDVILDYIGGEYADTNLKLLAVEGRMVIIGFLKGPKVKIDLSKIMLKRLHVTGSTLRGRDNDFKGAIARDIEEKVFPLFESKSIVPVIHKYLPLCDASEAHRIMESSNHIGKIILTP